MKIMKPGNEFFCNDQRNFRPTGDATNQITES